ncbi:MAG: type IV-A pilus assembly ATPase PilB [Bdellovibrionales bacterium]|nr:type IV-A pilus assembly ATPase PilB [Bdellovibrionales bacterium]
MSAARKGLGEILVKESLIDYDQLEQARKEQKASGGRLTSALVRLGYVAEKDLAEFLGRQFDVPTIDLNSFEIDPEALRMISGQVCEKHHVIPVTLAGKNLVVAFADPSNIFVKDDLALLTRCKIDVVVASEVSIANAIDKYYRSTSARFDSIMSEIADADESFVSSGSAAEVVDRESEADAGPIIRFVNATLAEAIKLKASDIHIEPYEKRFRIRFRIDGVLHEKTQPPPGTAAAVVSRIKIISKMDIGERRRPQDGRLKVRVKSGKEIDFRVNSVPTIYGEKIVLRILDKSNLQVDMTKLGMDDHQLELFQESIHRPQGMTLVTGPTGSGKTTTLYSALAALNEPKRNISTAEDPIEFNLDGINQVQVQGEIGVGFTEILRAFLRQDPEVIMLGEIRDLETANIAFKAASTGHLVLSTLHTNDAPASVARLLDMGVPGFMVAEAITLIIAQRLMRKICISCKTEIRVAPEVLISLGVKPEEIDAFKDLKKGEGCGECNGTGLKGRVAIYEMMPMTLALKESVLKGATPFEMKKAAVADGMLTLRASALKKLQMGLTTVQEVINSSVGDQK